MAAYNDTSGMNSTNPIFSNGNMFIRLAQHTLPVRPSLHNQYVIVDTYYRQLHMPQVYFDRLMKVIAVPDYTCTFYN